MSRILLVPLSLLVLLAAPWALRAEDAAPVAPPAMTMLVDLRGETTAAYAYGSWSGRISRSAEGIHVVGVKGAQGDGGFCAALPTPLDLSDVNYVEVALGVGQLNEVPEVTVSLGDADETQVTARLRIDQIAPSQAVWLRVPVSAFRPVGGQYAGKVAGMDWTKVAQWHLQGDWTTKKPVQVVFIAIRARR